MNKYLALQKDVFDINKVTVVGSPTITSDGIASGFSETSYIDAIKLLPNDKSWNINIEYTVSQADTATTNSKNIIYNSSGDKGIILIWLAWNSNADYLDFIINEEGGTQSTVRVTSNTKFVANDRLNITIGYDGQKYYQVAYKNGSLIQENSTISSNLVRQSDTGFLRLGARAGSVHYCTGSIDLKQFKIYVDNQLVFQPVKPTYMLERRKEGYDPSKFTVVGTPTITEYGVASGFSGSNYVTSNLLNISKSYDIEFISPIFTFNEFIEGGYNIVCQTSQRNTNTFLNIFTYGQGLTANVRQNGTDIFRSMTGALKVNTPYQIKMIYKNNQWEAYLKDNNGNFVKLATASAQLGYDEEGVTFENIQMVYGKESNTNYMRGLLDLSQTTFTVDNKEIFTGAKENYYMLNGI